MNTRYRCLTAGMLLYMCWTSLVQDMMGKEKYLFIVNHAWVDSWITIPLAILGIIGCAVLFHSTKSE